MKEAMNEPTMRPHLCFTTLSALGFALTLAACDGPNKQIGQLDGETGETDESGDSADTSDTGDGADETCAPAIADLEQKLAEEQANGNSCGLTLRFTYETAEFLGWQLRCVPPTPDLSLAEAQMMSAWPGTDQSTTEDAYVLYTEPGDFGGLTYVSKRSGLLFEGSIVWDGMGDIDYPDELEDPLMLGTGCADTQPPQAVELWPYNFIEGDHHVLPDEADPIIDAVWDTAVFYTVTSGTTIAVIAYPRTVGAFAPDVAEFVVIIDYP